MPNSKTEEKEEKTKSKGHSSFLAIVAIIGVVIVLIIAIIAYFFPAQASPTVGSYNATQTITLSTTTVITSTSPSLAGQYVALDTFSNIQGNLFLLNYPISDTLGTLTPVFINGANLPSNSYFGIFNRGNNPVNLVFAGFGNVPVYSIYTLASGHVLNILIDQNPSVYYTDEVMYPYFVRSGGTTVPVYNGNGSNFVVKQGFPIYDLTLYSNTVGSNPYYVLNGGNTLIFNNANGSLTSATTTSVFTYGLPTANTYYNIVNETGFSMTVYIYIPSVLTDPYPNTPDPTTVNTYTLATGSSLNLFFVGSVQVSPAPNHT